MRILLISSEKVALTNSSAERENNAIHVAILVMLVILQPDTLTRI
ncbi:MAG: hypothetical protein AAEI08_05390 [Gammaproteobacteria bacterium]